MASPRCCAAGGSMPPAPPILRVENLVKRFGGFRALDGVSFHLNRGEILGLVGPNGSGKTTCINVISGLYPPDGGAVYLQDQPIGGLPSHRLVHRGINRSFQIPKPFLTLTVRENLEVAIAYGRNPAGKADGPALLAPLRLAALAAPPAGHPHTTHPKTPYLAPPL